MSGPGERICVVAYDKIARELEEREVLAGVAPGSWRWMSAIQWTAAVTRGLQRRAQREERSGRELAVLEAAVKS